MSRTSKKLSIAAALAASGLIAACGGGGSSESTTNGSLKVSLTDAPACGFDAVNVTVSKVRVHQSASAGETEAGWSDITLASPKKINLLDLTNGVLDELGEVSLPSGSYTQIRLVLEENAAGKIANSVIPVGSTAEVALETPSAVRSGIKLINEFVVASDQKTELVLDFDACKSVVRKGNGGYLLKPVIKVVPGALNGIEGYITKEDLGANVLVTAQQNGTILSTTVPDKETGRFMLSRLIPGDYDVVITADGHATTVIGKVPVATTTSTVAVSSSGAPLDLQAAPSGSSRAINGTIGFSPAAIGEDIVSFAAAKQSFPSGQTVTVKYRGVDVSSGAYSLDNLPSVAPLYGQYSATLPINLAVQATTTPGTGKYAVGFGATGYQTKTETVDVTTADANVNVNLTK